MKILAGGPARETGSDLFKLHVECLEAQGDVTVRHIHTPDIGGPKWHRAKIQRVAPARQEMIVNAAVGPFDALFMVDTDVLAGARVLERMLKVDADVVYGVFWSYWPGFNEPQPQVWDRHPFGHSAHMKRFMTRAKRDRTISEYTVLGGGACTLIRNRGFESRYHPLLESVSEIGGMWEGEDRTYCLGLETRGIKQVAVFGLPIMHLDTPESSTPEKLAAAREKLL